MKTSDNDLKVNRNIPPDAVTCDRLRLIGPKSGHLGPIDHCLLEESQWENELFLSTQHWVLSLDVRPSLVQSSFSHWDSSSKQWLTGPNWPLLGPIRRILSHVTASGYIFRLTFRSLSDVFIPWWVSDEKKLSVCEKNVAAFRAVVKFCSTNRLFELISILSDLAPPL